ncbi:MAG TPA: polynucleotide adenylyltransferase PcnB, partial [Vicinamibacteria bacterium]|nr:polynucleotide adenylyltransferase PcnB [Vicinamibacteria bacterium]
MEYQPGNVAPRILSRAEHIISRTNIDPDALKVLYRLRNNGFVAYLVGGGVRDLLLERQPKDFDISTSAHPAQVKKLFRNCFVVGRRFRLCHVRFGRKVIEVSTFRSQAEPEEGDTLIRRDNTFGTPEQDAFRRDFTVNALFYVIATFSVIDWVGGLADLREKVISAIGDPGVRLREDPVRMLRAVALAARLGFKIDRDCEEAIRALRGEIVRSSPARILEEIFKILRQGRARETFLELHRHGLLAYLFPEAARALEAERAPLLESLTRLDAYRAAGGTVESLTNALLLGTLLVPLGVPLRRVPGVVARRRPEEVEAEGEPVDVAAEAEALGEDETDSEAEAAPSPAGTPFSLPFPRRDLDRLRVILLAQRRLPEIRTAPAVKHVLGARPYLDEALRWLEIHGGPGGAELAAHWRGLDLSDVTPEPVAPRGRPAPGPRP